MKKMVIRVVMKKREDGDINGSHDVDGYDGYVKSMIMSMMVMVVRIMRVTVMTADGAADEFAPCRGFFP